MPRRGSPADARMRRDGQDLHEIVELVKTKDLGAVVRFFYLAAGPRKKQAREKKREIEALKKERSRQKAEDDGAKGQGGSHLVEDLVAQAQQRPATGQPPASPPLAIRLRVQSTRAPASRAMSA